MNLADLNTMAASIEKMMKDCEAEIAAIDGRIRGLEDIQSSRTWLARSVKIARLTRHQNILESQWGALEEALAGIENAINCADGADDFEEEAA